MALNKYDIEFLKDMVPHHQEALKMVKRLGVKGSDARVKALAKSISSAQTGEIEKMKLYLSQAGQTITTKKSPGHN